MRKELDERLQQLQVSGESLQKAAQERTARLEEQSTRAQAFLIKAERAINTKVTADDLGRVQASFEATAGLPLGAAGADERRARALREDLRRLPGCTGSDSVAYQQDIEPVRAPRH